MLLHIDTSPLNCRRRFVLAVRSKKKQLVEVKQEAQFAVMDSIAEDSMTVSRSSTLSMVRSPSLSRWFAWFTNRLSFLLLLESSENAKRKKCKAMPAARGGAMARQSTRIVNVHFFFLPRASGEVNRNLRA